MLVATPMAALTVMAPAAAQEQDDLPFGPWQWANPQPQGNDLQFVAFNDAGTVIAGGEVGTLMRSTDFGQTWTQRPNPVTDREAAAPLAGDAMLREAEFLNADIAVAVSNDGTILRSTDGGTSWSDAETIPASANDILGVSFADATTGYVVGNETGTNAPHAMRSTDGGRTWAKPFQFSLPIGERWTLLDVSAPTPQIAFATSNDARVVRTTDGGNSWQPIVQLGSGDFFLHAVDFVDDDTGVVVGEGGRIFRTADGGDTWRQVPSGVFQHRLMDVTFVSDDIGYVVGELPAGETESGGVVLKTEDGGQSWTPIADTPQWARGVAFADQDTGVVVGTDGMMRRTTDGGQSWTPRWSAATTLNLNGVAFPEPDNGWAVGGRGTQESTLLRSTDGGLTWTPQDSPTTTGLFDIDFADSIHGVAVGVNGTIMRTVDGGDRWVEQDSGTSRNLRSVSCPTVNVCTAVGYGAILRTEDGGASWEPQDENFGQTVGGLEGVGFKNESEGFAVGRGSGRAVLSRTTDGGATWQDVSPLPLGDGRLYDVASVDADTWVVVGDPDTGSVLRSTDGGASWSVPAEPDEPFGFFQGVAFADDGTGYAGDLTGQIWRTSDGGVTWSPEQRRHNNPVTGVALVDPADPGTAVAVGWGGAILRRSGGGGGGPGEPPSEASQDIVATVPEQPGEGSLIISVDPGDRTVTLPPVQLAGTGDRLATSGELRPVTVTDTRSAANPGWDVSAQVSEFNSDTASFSGGFLGWSPEVVSQSEGQTVTAGGPVAPGFPTGDGLAVPQTLATAPAGAGVGAAQLGAGLALQVPVDTPAGTYTAVLTLTAI